MTLGSDLEDQGTGRCMSIPCRNFRTGRVLPDERGSCEIAETQPDAVQDAEQVPSVKQWVSHTFLQAVGEGGLLKCSVRLSH